MFNTRLALRSDINRIRDINITSLPIAYDHKEYIEFILSPKTIIMICSLDNNIIGYIVGKWYTETRFHIMTFAVDKTYRRHGVGKRLMNDIVKYASTQHKPEKITLYVQIENKIAIEFYKSQGFTDINLKKNYYGSKSHAYMMTKVEYDPTEF